MKTLSVSRSHVGTAGLLLGQSKPVGGSKLQTMTSNINLTDKWARIHLARLCSALVYAEWTSTQSFVSGVGAPMWKMLVMLATRLVTHNLLLSSNPKQWECILVTTDRPITVTGEA